MLFDVYYWVFGVLMEILIVLGEIGACVMLVGFVFRVPGFLKRGTVEELVEVLRQGAVMCVLMNLGLVLNTLDPIGWMRVLEPGSAVVTSATASVSLPDWKTSHAIH